jgi:hypothetical protein
MIPTHYSAQCSRIIQNDPTNTEYNTHNHKTMPTKPLYSTPCPPMLAERRKCQQSFSTPQIIPCDLRARHAS